MPVSLVCSHDDAVLLVSDVIELARADDPLTMTAGMNGSVERKLVNAAESPTHEDVALSRADSRILVSRMAIHLMGDNEYVPSYFQEMILGIKYPRELAGYFRTRRWELPDQSDYDRAKTTLSGLDRVTSQIRPVPVLRLVAKFHQDPDAEQAAA